MTVQMIVNMVQKEISVQIEADSIDEATATVTEHLESLRQLQLQLSSSFGVGDGDTIANSGVTELTTNTTRKRGRPSNAEKADRAKALAQQATATTPEPINPPPSGPPVTPAPPSSPPSQPVEDDIPGFLLRAQPPALPAANTPPTVPSSDVTNPTNGPPTVPANVTNPTLPPFLVPNNSPPAPPVTLGSKVVAELRKRLTAMPPGSGESAIVGWLSTLGVGIIGTAGFEDAMGTIATKTADEKLRDVATMLGV